MSIGANSKPIFTPWEQVQQKIQPAFCNCMVKFCGGTQGFHQKVNLQSIAIFGQNMVPPAVLSAGKKIAGILSTKAK